MPESAHKESKRKIDFPSFTDRHNGKVAAEAAEARSMYVNMHVPIKINPSRPALTLREMFKSSSPKSGGSEFERVRTEACS